MTLSYLWVISFLPRPVLSPLLQCQVCDVMDSIFFSFRHGLYKVRYVVTSCEELLPDGLAFSTVIKQTYAPRVSLCSWRTSARWSHLHLSSRRGSHELIPLPPAAWATLPATYSANFSAVRLLRHGSGFAEVAHSIDSWLIYLSPLNSKDCTISNYFLEKRLHREKWSKLFKMIF